MKQEPIATVERVEALPDGFHVYHTRGRMFFHFGAELYRGHLYNQHDDASRGVRDEAGAYMLAVQILELARKVKAPKPEIERAPLNLGAGAMTRFTAGKGQAA